MSAAEGTGNEGRKPEWRASEPKARRAAAGRGCRGRPAETYRGRPPRPDEASADERRTVYGEGWQARAEGASLSHGQTKNRTTNTPLDLLHQVDGWSHGNTNTTKKTGTKARPREDGVSIHHVRGVVGHVEDRRSIRELEGANRCGAVDSVRGSQGTAIL